MVDHGGVGDRKRGKGMLIDVQNQADDRCVPIDRVGVSNLSYPIVVLDRANQRQPTVASITMSVNLPHHFKGTHMSRFVEILHLNERELSVESFRDMLKQMVERLDAETGHIEMTFPYFVMKAAPVSGVKSLLDYRATLIGEIRKDRVETWIKVVVPVTSLCPCSK